MSEKMTIQAKLLAIQSELKAPKGQYNKFGKYNYRSAEDIIEAVKPICKKYDTVLLLGDEIELIGDRYYVKATAILTDLESGASVQTQAYAREEQSRSGMSADQLTGACSSYARKYCLNGLLMIDDSKDSDTDENHEIVSEAKKNETKQKAEQAMADDPLITHDKVEVAVAVIRGKQTTLANVLSAYGVEALKDMRESQYADMMKRLDKTPNK